MPTSLYADLGECKMRPVLTVDEARHMDFEDLLTRSNAILEAYDAPDGGETSDEQIARVGKTIDEMPDVYRWFLVLQSHFDHWTDAMNDQWGLKSREYKSMRQRRDAMERMASAAKRRYEGASRVITVLLRDEETTQMPRGRS